MGTSSSQFAVEVTDLTVVRGGKVVLQSVSLTIPRGQLVGLLGPSGSGKSTLIRSIVGSQVIESGSVCVLGAQEHTPGTRGRIGYVTQAPSVYADLTVKENLQYFAALVGVGEDSVGATIRDVGLTDQAHQTVATLSGGQASRVSLGVALLGSPELLVLDEPTVGLDPVLRNDLWALFRSLTDHGTTVLVSSHVMDEATRCDRLLFMRDGALLADGTLKDILTRTNTSDAESAFLELAQQERS